MFTVGDNQVAMFEDESHGAVFVASSASGEFLAVCVNNDGTKC
jgi:hypothetical protein